MQRRLRQVAVHLHLVRLPEVVAHPQRGHQELRSLLQLLEAAPAGPHPQQRAEQPAHARGEEDQDQQRLTDLHLAGVRRLEAGEPAGDDGTHVPEDLLAVQLDLVHGGSPPGCLHIVRRATSYVP